MGVNTGRRHGAMGRTDGRLPQLAVVERATYLQDAVRGRSMLSVGLGGYADERSYSYSLATTDPRSTLSGKLAAAAREATFADLSTEAIDAFRSRVPGRYHHVDVTAPLDHWPADLRTERFDVVVIGEVLEHLDNPGAALRNLHRLVGDGGSLIVTVPNAYSLSGVVRVLVGRETTHPEHASHYSYVTLHRLLEMNGLRSVELLWYRWGRSGGSRVVRLKRKAASLLTGVAPQLSHGLIAVVPAAPVPE